MKENKYDEESFFASYARMPRSVKGLAAAGEWHALRPLLPDLRGTRVLDIGCGFGWHCVYAAQQGAVQVLGIDIAARMLDAARTMTDSRIVEYRQTAMEDLDFPEESFDVVLSSLALHYTPDFRVVCAKVAHFLAPGGTFVFSVEHPVFTAEGSQEWVTSPSGERLCWPVDRYFMEGARTTNFLGHSVVKYHRTLTTYLTGLDECGFRVTAMVEPQPAGELLDTVDGMRDELRRPMMLLVRAVKA